MAVTVAQLKEHLYLGHDLDDAMLGRLIAAAEDYLAQIGTRSPQGAGLPDRAASHDHAVTLLAAGFYHQREGATDVNDKETAFGVSRLTAPFRCSIG